MSACAIRARGNEGRVFGVGSAPEAQHRPPDTRHGTNAVRQSRGTDEAGFALFAVLLLTALLFSLGAFGARMAQIELAISGNDLQSKRALHVAEAGINHAVSLIADMDPVARRNEAADGFDDELNGNGALAA